MVMRGYANSVSYEVPEEKIKNKLEQEKRRQALKEHAWDTLNVCGIQEFSTKYATFMIKKDNF